MDVSTFLYDVSPAVVERFCQIMDGGDRGLGWRALAVHIVPSFLEVRMLERVEAAGRSPTKEMLWSWAQQNSRVQDLLKVLRAMGHRKALQLFQGPDRCQLQALSPQLHSPFIRLCLYHIHIIVCLSKKKKNRNRTLIDYLGNLSISASPLQSNAESPGLMSAAKVKESFQPEVNSSSQGLCLKLNSTGEDQRPSITFQDIVEGTRHFHRDMRIAEGHFSDVYTAEIGSKKLAVKLFKQTGKVSWKKLWDIFRKEMEIRHLYQHPNILELLCCFSDGGRYCLVFPYLPNGSLFHWIHGQHGKPPLYWPERLSIIKGIAKALHYLHTARPHPMICGNISSSNILLDDALQPKLFNFGLADLRPHSASHRCTVTLDTSSKNNLGYFPEEYIRDDKLSFSLDVYSLGMVIMETVTGRKVIEEVPKQTQLRDLLVSELEDSGGVDSCLRFLDGAAGQWPTAVALSLLGLAVTCTASRHRSRPSMENVILALSKLLPPPSCPLSKQLHSLKDGIPFNAQKSPSASLTTGHDEQHSALCSPTQAGPCECSQSEVMYLSDVAGAHGEVAVDLYRSWPVQCSCPAETGAGLTCEDCRANGFTPVHADGGQTFFGVEENAAKERLKNKLSLYDKGLIHTEELFSESAPQ